MGNPQLIQGFIAWLMHSSSVELPKDIRGIVKGYSQNHQRVSEDLLKGIVQSSKASIELRQRITVESLFWNSQRVRE